MKQDKLEKFLTENREKFDLYDPDPELWNKINQENRKRKEGIKYSGAARGCRLLFFFNSKPNAKGSASLVNIS